MNLLSAIFIGAGVFLGVMEFVYIVFPASALSIFLIFDPFVILLMGILVLKRFFVMQENPERSLKFITSFSVFFMYAWNYIAKVMNPSLEMKSMWIVLASLIVGFFIHEGMRIKKDYWENFTI